MAAPLNLPLRARRNAPFSRVWSFTDDDGDAVDLSAAVVTMQVRQYGAQPDTALISLIEVATANTEGLLVAGGNITAFIDETSLLLLPSGAAGKDVVFTYDLVVDLADRVAEVWAEGTFTVTPGVTDRLRILTNDAGDLLVSDAGKILIAG